MEKAKTIEQSEFTYGFEIEGLFRRGLFGQLQNKGEFKWDGSVHNVENHQLGDDLELIPQTIPGSCNECVFDSGGTRLSYCERHHARYGNEGRASSEYASEVYDDLNLCLKDLSKFHDPDWFAYNQTCGLHFHIGIKGNKHNQLFSIASNYTYLRKLYKEALKWCDHQKARLSRDSHFYAFWNDRFDLIRGVNFSEKYRFIRFHSTFKTLECRFLCPCEHKVENVKKLVASLTKFLNQDQHNESSATIDTDSIKRKKIELSYTIKKFVSSKIEKVKKLYEPEETIESYDYRPPNEIPRHPRMDGLDSPSFELRESMRRDYQSQLDRYRNVIQDRLGVSGANPNQIEAIFEMLNDRRDMRDIMHHVHAPTPSEYQRFLDMFLQYTNLLEVLSLQQNRHTTLTRPPSDSWTIPSLNSPI